MNHAQTLHVLFVQTGLVATYKDRNVKAGEHREGFQSKRGDAIKRDEMMEAETVCSLVSGSHQC